MRKVLDIFVSLLILFLIFVNLARFLNFALKIAGFEHDSGWYFGVAANLALHGKYASYTNPVIEGETSGIVVNKWNRPSIIDQEDLEFFPSGVSVGPAFLIPVASFVRFFGVGYWQFRLFPILTYFLLLGLSIWLVIRFSGKFGIIFLLVFLNLFPQLAIPIAFESFAEPTGLFYLLLGATLLDLSLKLKQKQENLIFLAGIFFSFSLLTKTLYLFGFLAAVLLYSGLLFRGFDWRKKIIKLVYLVAGFLLPILLFEIYCLVVLTRIAGVFAYLANLSSHLIVFVSAGSGLGENPTSLKDKFKVFSEIGFSSWQKVALLFCSLLFLFYLDYRKDKKKRSFLLELLLIYWLINSCWFLFLNSTGWARHFWPGLFLAVIFMASFMGNVFFNFFLKKNWQALAVILLFLVIIFQPASLGLIFKAGLPENLTAFWRDKYFEQMPQGLPLPIFSLVKQKEAVDFIKKEIPPKGKIYYLGNLLVAEIPPLVDRVFYEVTRAHQANSELNYVIFGPYQVSLDWRIISQQSYLDQVKKFCQKELFDNDYYKVCLLGGISSNR